MVTILLLLPVFIASYPQIFNCQPIQSHTQSSLPYPHKVPIANLSSRMHTHQSRKKSEDGRRESLANRTPFEPLPPSHEAKASSNPKACPQALIRSSLGTQQASSSSATRSSLITFLLLHPVFLLPVPTQTHSFYDLEVL